MFKTNWVNDGINIKHYDRIYRQMTEFLFLMLKQQNTERK